MIALVELLQAGELRSVAALRSSIDHQDRLAGVIGEPDAAAFEAVEGEGKGGDPAHGRRLCERCGRRRKSAGEEGQKTSAIRDH